jgi:hypothetical protein
MRMVVRDGNMLPSGAATPTTLADGVMASKMGSSSTAKLKKSKTPVLLWWWRRLDVVVVEDAAILLLLGVGGGGMGMWKFWCNLFHARPVRENSFFFSASAERRHGEIFLCL